MKKLVVVPLLLLIVFVIAAHSYLNLLAPFSSSLWEVDRSTEVPNPYG